jgi:hypothetical protein
MTRFQLAYLALMSIVTAGSSADPLRVPRAIDVLSIDATMSNSRDSVHIDDPKKVSEILGVFDELNHNMSIPFGTFPTPTHSLVVNDSRGINLVIFVGLDWIGGKNIVSGTVAESRATHISESQRAWFLKVVGIDDYRFR